MVTPTRAAVARFVLEFDEADRLELLRHEDPELPWRPFFVPNQPPTGWSGERWGAAAEGLGRHAGDA